MYISVLMRLEPGWREGGKTGRQGMHLAKGYFMDLCYIGLFCISVCNFCMFVIVTVLVS